MPASRSATRDAAELEKLVGQEIRCRITKLDVTEEDVVVDRRALAEEEERLEKSGAIARSRRRHRAGNGAQPGGLRRVLDIGGIDGLLHVSDIAWARQQAFRRAVHGAGN